MGTPIRSDEQGVRLYSYGRHHPRIHPTVFLCPGSYIVGKVTIHRRASIWFGAVLRGDFGRIQVGDESLIEDNVVVHGNVMVGKRCVVGHGAILHGCSLGDDVVIGANAVVFDRALIGDGALIAAGSVVYPGTKVASRTVFRNSARANNPLVGPVGDRTKRWQASSYSQVIAVYRRSDHWTRGGRPRRRGMSRRVLTA